MYLAQLLKKGVQVTCRCLHSSQRRGLQTMQAWQAYEYGGPENLQLNTAAPIPVIKGCMDVLVKVHAASVNPLDIQMLEGYGSTAFNAVRQVNNCSFSPQDFPLILGRDFSGTVVHVGKNVKSIDLKCGDEVWGALSPWENGSHAEYLLVHACTISKKPTSLSHVESASLPYAALTAWCALCRFGGLSEKNMYGKRVLIIGSSGGVGTFAVQLLKSWGAEVTATCRSDAVEMILNLGADTVLDYEDPDFKNNLKQLNRLDVIFDTVGGEYPDLTINFLKKWGNGKYITVVSPLLKNADDRGILIGTFTTALQAGFDTAMSFKDGRSFRWAYFMPSMCGLKSIAKMVDKKQINPVVEKVYKFEDIPQAYEKLISGHARGKTVIDYTFADTKASNEVKQEQNV